ncbi:glycosyltransferase family 39 protein [Paenibacillus albicereus]|uniref:Glycosyltransferase family 39 protein n=1 Tax=Paenibacillus albicereus TaxID=2726185 RepID=A0A6H2GSL9_9BACL|nr:glycosyltransferase family 39 protein [Paenibacillus albicereus]QJC50414.1 glycosyltransferase family 39 protein [Paenibacillus albicereus]
MKSHRLSSSRTGLYAVFGFVLLLEFGFGFYLAAVYGFMSGDASSRVANAFYVLYSREPGLANIGFVWNPLPSLMELVVLVFYPLYKGLAAQGIAAVIVSSLFAALTAVQLVRAGDRFGLRRRLSVLLALLYAFNPYIFYYGANGLTEAIFIYFITICVVQLLLWMGKQSAGPLVLAAVALALAFWTRYETVFFGAALALAVLIWIVRDREETLKHRLQQAEGTWTLLLAPVVYSGLLWIFFNWTIMGDPLYFLTSDYGNLGQAELLQDEKFQRLIGNPWNTLLFVGERTAYFSLPLLAILLIRLYEGRLLRRDVLLLLLLALSIPAMQFILLLRGGTAAWIRYYMYVFPIAAAWMPYEISRLRHRRTGVALLLVSLAGSGYVMLGMMNDPTIASDEYEAFRQNKLYAEQQAGKQMTDVIDRELPGRTILTDSFSSFRIVMGSDSPRQFLITSDSEFADALEAPAEHGVEYVLVPNPQAVLSLDEVNKKYPSLYEQGADWAELYRQAGEYWKLYKVKPETE